jgi:hypothetical protein
MSISFLPNGNSTVIAANTTSGAARVALTRAGGTQLGAFMIDNLSANAVIFNYSIANTVTANVATGVSNGQGFAIPAGATKFLDLHQGTNVTPPATVYVVANAVVGTATVNITPVYIYK